MFKKTTLTKRITACMMAATMITGAGAVSMLMSDNPIIGITANAADHTAGTRIPVEPDSTPKSAIMPFALNETFSASITKQNRDFSSIYDLKYWSQGKVGTTYKKIIGAIPGQNVTITAPNVATNNNYMTVTKLADNKYQIKVKKVSPKPFNLVITNKQGKKTIFKIWVTKSAEIQGKLTSHSSDSVSLDSSDETPKVLTYGIFSGKATNKGTSLTGTTIKDFHVEEEANNSGNESGQSTSHTNSGWSSTSKASSQQQGTSDVLDPLAKVAGNELWYNVSQGISRNVGGYYNESSQELLKAKSVDGVKKIKANVADNTQLTMESTHQFKDVQVFALCNAGSKINLGYSWQTHKTNTGSNSFNVHFDSATKGDVVMITFTDAFGNKNVIELTVE